MYYNVMDAIGFGIKWVGISILLFVSVYFLFQL